MGIAISSENRSGGQGKTTTVIALATWLARSYPNEHFLIINTDPQNDASIQLGIDELVGDRCLTQYVLGERGLADVTIAASSKDGWKRPNLFYIPAGPDFEPSVRQMQTDYGETMAYYGKISAAARRRQNMSAPLSPTQQFLESLLPLKSERGPAVIFIDCPPSLGPLRQMVHWFVDYVIVPVVPGTKEVAMTIRHTMDIAEDRKNGAPSRIMSVVPNCFDTRLSLHNDYLDQLREVYKDLLWQPPVPRRTVVGQAASKGYSIVEVDPYNEVSTEYRKLAMKVAKAAGLPPVEEEEERETWVSQTG